MLRKFVYKKSPANNVTLSGSRDFHLYSHSQHAHQVFLLHYVANKRNVNFVNLIWDLDAQADKKSIHEYIHLF